MAGFLQVELPSEDEEDQSYNPLADRGATRDEQHAAAAARGGGLRVTTRLGEAEGRAGSPAGPAGRGGAGDGDDKLAVTKQRARQKRVRQAWEQLRAGGGGGAGGAGGRPAPAAKKPRKAVAFDRVATAQAALAAARELSKVGAGKVLITEQRNFAGENVTVTREVDAKSKDAAQAAGRARERTRGIDFVLAVIEKKKRVNIVDKSRIDWKDFKRDNAAVQKELDHHNKSGDKYLDKQAFLQRSEWREFQQERDKRLSYQQQMKGKR